MDDLHGDRAQKQALNTTEASRSHHDMLDAFVASCLGDRFRRLTGSDDALKSNSGRLSFSNRLFKCLGRCLRSCLLPIISIAAPTRSMALMFCTLSSTSEVPGF